MKIAILGATGHIGRSLIRTLQEKHADAVFFSRDSEKGKERLMSFGIEADLQDYRIFQGESFDVVVNATGIGSPTMLKEDPAIAFAVTEQTDGMIFEYLSRHPQTRVFNMSSGAVYGLSASSEVSENTLATFNPSDFRSGDYYSLAKLYSEAKHRAAAEFPIIDLRVFGFISRWLDLEESFFISEVARCLKRGEELVTMPTDMVRDYATADDIWAVIEFLCAQEPQNAAFDMQSRSPVSKFELLARLTERFNLKYKVSDTLADTSPTGAKNAYYSASRTLQSLGYTSRQTALQNVEQEIGALLKEKK